MKAFIRAGYQSKLKLHSKGVFAKEISIDEKNGLCAIPIVEPIKIKLGGSFSMEISEKLEFLFSQYPIRLKLTYGHLDDEQMYLDGLSWAVIDMVIVNGRDRNTDFAESFLTALEPTKLKISNYENFNIDLESVHELIWKSASKRDFSCFPNLKTLHVFGWPEPSKIKGVETLIIHMYQHFGNFRFEEFYQHGVRTIHFTSVNSDKDGCIKHVLEKCPDLKLIVGQQVMSLKHTNLLDLV
jgi:hypothetical protein